MKAEYAYCRQSRGPIASLLIAADAELQYAVRHWCSLYRLSLRLIERYNSR